MRIPDGGDGNCVRRLLVSDPANDKKDENLQLSVSDTACRVSLILASV